MHDDATTPPPAPRSLDPGASSALVFAGGLLLGLTATGLGPHPGPSDASPAAVARARTSETAGEERLLTPLEQDRLGALSNNAPGKRPGDRPRDGPAR